MSRKTQSFLLIYRSVKRITFCQRARSVFTVTPEFDLLLIISVRTIVTAVRFQSRKLTLALRKGALMLATHVDQFCQ